MIKATSSAHISAEKLVLGPSQLNISCNWLNIALLTTASTESVTGTSTVAVSCASCYIELAHPSLFHKDKLPSKKIHKKPSRRNLPNTLNRWNNSYSQRQKRESEIDPETAILCNPWIHSWFGDIFFSVVKGWLFQPSQNFSKCWLILAKNT